MTTFTCIAAASVHTATDPLWAGAVPTANRRRDPRIWQMAHVAVARLFATTAIRPASIISATALGALDETKNYLDGIFAENLGSPRNFIASVHNSMAGKLAIDFAITGPNLTVCDGPNSLASALAAAALLDPCDFPLLVVAVDEQIELLLRLAPYCAPQCQSLLVSNVYEGAAAFLLTTDSGSTSIAADAPRLCGGFSIDQRWEQIMRGYPGATSVHPNQTNRSFVHAALTTVSMINDTAIAKAVIGSYSPASDSIAAVIISR